jgi:hypothetical protein
MPNPTDKIIAALEADWPHWQIWVVHRVVGGRCGAPAAGTTNAGC